MENKYISPWSLDVKVPSPNRKLLAIVKNTSEICMGGPSYGKLVVSNGMEFTSCSPSIIWSTDSRYLAVPEWTRHRSQRLLILDVVNNSTFYAEGEYRVLQLESFVDGVIEGIDSPIHLKEPVRIDINVSKDTE